MTISKFEDQRKFAIATKLVYLYRADVYMDGRFRSNIVNVLFFVCLFLRVSSAPAHSASSPDRSGNPRLPTRSEGVSWTDSSVVEDPTLIPTLSNLVC